MKQVLTAVNVRVIGESAFSADQFLADMGLGLDFH
jgi:hypothetical protein